MGGTTVLPVFIIHSPTSEEKYTHLHMINWGYVTKIP